jgi:hypothetical protein
MQDNSKLIEEYHSIKSFIDKYIFYQNHWRELRFIEPTNPLMIEFEEASKVLDENDKRIKGNQVGVIYVRMDSEYFKAKSGKSNADDAITQYYKNKKLEEPKPSNDAEGGQVIEFWVNNYQQESTFEDKKIEFLESIEGKNYASEIATKQIEKVQFELDKIIGINNLNTNLSETYKIDFTKIFEFVRIENEILKVKDHIKAYTNPIFISYEPLAKAIPFIQYKKFLEDFLKDDLVSPPQVQSEEERKKVGRPKGKTEERNNEMWQRYLLLTKNSDHRTAIVEMTTEFKSYFDTEDYNNLKRSIERIIKPFLDKN